jgi:hypothetical protein
VGTRGHRKRQQVESIYAVLFQLLQHADAPADGSPPTLRIAEFGCGSGNVALPLVRPSVVMWFCRWTPGRAEQFAVGGPFGARWFASYRSLVQSRLYLCPNRQSPAVIFKPVSERGANSASRRHCCRSARSLWWTGTHSRFSWRNSAPQPLASPTWIDSMRAPSSTCALLPHASSIVHPPLHHVD